MFVRDVQGPVSAPLCADTQVFLRLHQQSRPFACWNRGGVSLNAEATDLRHFATVVQLQLAVRLVSQQPLHLVLQHVAVDEALQLFDLLRSRASGFG